MITLNGFNNQPLYLDPAKIVGVSVSEKSTEAEPRCSIHVQAGDQSEEWTIKESAESVLSKIPKPKALFTPAMVSTEYYVGRIHEAILRSATWDESLERYTPENATITDAENTVRRILKTLRQLDSSQNWHRKLSSV